MKKLKLLATLALASVIFITGCKKNEYQEKIGVCPLVVSTVPADKAIDVPLNQIVTATFNEEMNPATISQESFTLLQGTTPVSGTVSYTALSAAFAPVNQLEPFTTYTARIKTSVKDLMNNALQTDFVWSFTTIPFIVSAPSPIAGGTTSGTGTFNQGSLVTLTATPNSGYSFLNWTENGTIVSTSSSYQLTMAGNKSLVANFTLISSGFSLNVVANNGSVLKNPDMTTYTSGASVVLTAVPNSGYKFTGWSGDALGSVNPLTVIMNSNKNITANFIADIQPPLGPLAIDLGCAGPFAVLAGSTIASTGPSIINGNVGLSAGSALIGFPPGIINGTQEITTPAAAAAKLCLTSAFIDGQGRSLNAISLPGQLGGLTLAPGLYTNSSTSGISGTGANGILTLDAQGDANAVWIFQIGSTFTTDPATSIVLAGGAKAANIFWIVGTSATLGTTSVFYGNILADQSITLNTGAVLNGRALTRIAAVTLDASTITKP